MADYRDDDTDLTSEDDDTVLTSEDDFDTGLMTIGSSVDIWNPEFPHQLIPSADRTALLFQLSYLSLGGFPKLERLIRKQAVETQLLFGSSEAVLLKCVGTSYNLANDLLPMLVKAVENNKTDLAECYIEKAKTWISDIITRVKDIVKSDVNEEKKKTEEKNSRNTMMMKDLESAVSKLEVELTNIVETQKILETKYQQQIIKLQKSSSLQKSNELQINCELQKINKLQISSVPPRPRGRYSIMLYPRNIGACCYRIYTVPNTAANAAANAAARTAARAAAKSRAAKSRAAKSRAAKSRAAKSQAAKSQAVITASKTQAANAAGTSQAIKANLLHLTSEKQNLQRKEWEIHHKLTDLQLQLARKKIDNGEIPNPVQLKDVKKCLFQIQKVLIELQRFWENVESILGTLKEKTFVNEKIFKDEVFKENFKKCVQEAIKNWEKFGTCCNRTQDIFRVQSTNAYDFLETDPSSLSKAEWNNQYETIMKKFNQISAQAPALQYM